MGKMMIHSLQRRIGSWSRANFGQQETWQLAANGDGQVALGSLAPLLGIVEEIGEFYDEEVRPSSGKDATANQVDALGDVGVYLCDYASREGVELQGLLGFATPTELQKALPQLHASVGNLVHATLKRLQGIRGYDSDAKYIDERDEALKGILGALIALCQYHGGFIPILEKTFDNVIAKRDWKKAPEDGGGHTHEDGADPPISAPIADGTVGDEQHVETEAERDIINDDHPDHAAE